MLRVRPYIVLFGDSITQEAFGSVDGSNVGWASLLSAAYSRRADVFNRGFSGYNSRHGVDLLPRMLPTTNMASSSSNEGGHNTLFWTIFFGANDATLPGQRQHVPLKEYSENIKKMVEMIQSHKSASSSSRIEVILITPPPVNPSMWESYCLTNFGERRGKRDLKLVQKYADKVREAGKQLSCPVLDLFEIFGSNNGDFFSDGLHLSSLGNKLVFEGLMNLIKRDFPSKAPLEEGGDVGLPLEDKLWSELC